MLASVKELNGPPVAARLGLTLIGLAVLLLRGAVEPRAPQAIGIVAVRDLALTLLLWLTFTFVATAVGHQALRLIAPRGISEGERLSFGFALGAGSISLLILVAALLHALNRTAISAILLAALWWAAPTGVQLLRSLPQVPGRLRGAWHQSGPLGKIATVLVAIIGLLALANALSPPWDYDGLMYHLLGPKLFLDAGRIFPFPDNWYVNGPFNIEMLFTVGMSFGDDVFPKLVHLTFGVCYLAASYQLAVRVLRRDAAWLVPLILLGVPTLPIWASFAYIDLGWSAFEVLSMIALVAWWQTRDGKWLLLGGAASGLACGSKYLGLVGLAMEGVAVLAVLTIDRSRPRLRSLYWFAFPASVFGAAWYIKNLLWFGNPIFPLGFGGGGWTPERLMLYSDYLRSFGTGTGLLDYLLLPINVYAQHASFGTVMNSIDIPSLLFPLALAAPFYRPNRAVKWLLLAGGVSLAVWSVGSQQLRFLLPIYPVLAIGSAHVMSTLLRRYGRSVGGMIWPALALGLVFVTAFYQGVVTLKFRPIPAEIGTESRESFLLRINKDYPSIVHFLNTAPESGKLLMLGDARGYLCLDRCVPDPDHFRWAAQIATMSTDPELALWFADRDISHLLFSVEDLDFLLQHDPHGVLRAGIQRLLSWRDAGCLRSEFSDGWSTLYRVLCRPSASASPANPLKDLGRQVSPAPRVLDSG